MLPHSAVLQGCWIELMSSCLWHKHFSDCPISPASKQDSLECSCFQIYVKFVLQSSQYPASEQRLRYSVVSYSVYCGVCIFFSVCIKHMSHVQILSNWMMNLSSIIKSHNPWPWKEKFVVMAKFFKAQV